MRNLSLLLLLFFSPVSHATDEYYHQLLEQYKKNDDSIAAEYVEGKIDGEDHVVMLASAIPEAPDGPLILVFKKTADQFDAVAKVDSAIEYYTDIKNNSIYVIHTIAHHGVYGSRYQFKKIRNEFRLIGLETQAEYFTCDGLSESEDCKWESDTFSGRSYNFLTSSAVCWQEMIDFENEKQWHEAFHRRNNWRHPKRGSRYEMPFRKIDPPLLNGFNFSEFDLPETCFFDRKNKLHIEH
jgi:hypothetical protein